MGAAGAVLAGHQQLIVLLAGCGETTRKAERGAELTLSALPSS